MKVGSRLLVKKYVAYPSTNRSRQLSINCNSHQFSWNINIREIKFIKRQFVLLPLSTQALLAQFPLVRVAYFPIRVYTIIIL